MYTKLKVWVVQLKEKEFPWVEPGTDHGYHQDAK